MSLCVVLALFGSAPAQAAVIIDFQPPFPSNPEYNILFNDPGLTLAGTTVEGITNASPGTIFHFTGGESLLADGGQARITGADGGFTSLLVEPASPLTWFSAFEANLDVLKPARGHASGVVTITVYDRFGAATVAQHAIGSQGSNFFNLLAGAPDLMRAVLIESTVTIGEVRQIRVGGVQAGSSSSDVPEPGELFLLGAGLLALGRRLRRRAQPR